MRVAAVLLGFLFSIAMFSGCADSAKPTATATTTGAPTGSADVGSESEGAIRGFAVDNERVPIPNVRISIRENSQEVITGQDGAFEILGLEMGSFTVFAVRLGYEQVMRKVELTADEPEVELDFVLQAIIVEEEFHQTQIYKGYMTCGGTAVPYCGILDELAQDYGTPNPTNEHWLFNYTYPDGKAPKTMVTEVLWTPTVSGTEEEDGSRARIPKVIQAPPTALGSRRIQKL